MTAPTSAHDHLPPAARLIDIDPEWLDFGPDDPLDAAQWINPCLACSAMPRLGLVDTRWQVTCDCGQAGSPALLAATAAVNWNKSPLSRHPHYRTLPFFALHDLPIPQARAKLLVLREYLEEQKRRCERRIRARENFGHRYFQRIRAYLAWAIYAQGLIREAEMAVIKSASTSH